MPRCACLLLWVGGVLCAVVMALVGWAELGFEHLITGLYLVPAGAYTATQMVRSHISNSRGPAMPATVGVIVGPVVLGLDWLARSNGLTVRVWWWAGLGAIFVVFCVIGFAQRFWRIADKTMLVQIAAEALLLAALTTVSLWEWLFADAPGTDANRFAVGLLVVIYSVLATVIAVGSIREPHPQFTQLGLIALPSVLAPLVLVYLQLSDRAAWPGHVFHILAWSALLGSFVRFVSIFRPGSVTLESLRSALIGITVGVMIGVSVLSLLLDPRVEPLTWAMIGVICVSLIARDVITTRRSERMNLQLRDQAMTDPLTALSNRRALDKWIADQGSIELAPISVLTLDLDQFKDVNDLLGHGTGDQLLIATAKALTELVEPRGSSVFRMGGDEFMVIAPMPDDVAEALARDLIAVVDDASGTVPGVARLAVGGSVGVRHVPKPRTSESLLNAITQSSQAMRAAKQAGKGRVHVFDDTLQTDYNRRKVVELRLREQLHAVGVHYQPIVDVSGRVTGFEALARWTDSELGVVPPTEFVSVAEHANLIADLGMSILTRAVAEMTASGHLGPQRKLNVNVSALQLRMPSFVDRVFDLLEEHRLPRHQLVLELTESTTLQHDGPIGTAMARLAAGGVRLAIDDFGAGATSVGYLSRLPVSSVKIDRSLTNGLRETSTAATVRGVIELCRGLGLRVVLEGVESRDQEQQAQLFGVDYLQGWLYAPALPLAALGETIERLTPREAPLGAQPRR